MNTNLKNYYIDDDLNTEEEKAQNSIANIEYLIIYSLIIAFSLSLNGFFHLILSKLEFKEHVLAQFVYLMILFILMIILTYCLNIRLKF
jgi:diacylglycerol kinase